MAAINATILKNFNKAGARLLEKITKTPLEKVNWHYGNKEHSVMLAFHGMQPPQEAVYGSYVRGETSFGQRSFERISFFDENGKIMQCYDKQFVGDDKSPLIKLTAYSWRGGFFKSLRSNAYSFGGGERSTNCVVLGPKGLGGIRATSTLKPQDGTVFVEAGRNKDLPATEHIADKFETEIHEIGRKNPKTYKRTTFYEPSTGVFKPLKGEGKNLTSEEMATLDADSYLPLRIQNSGINSYEYIAKDAFHNQGIPLDTNVYYDSRYLDSIGVNACSHEDGIIFEDQARNIPFATNAANHEARHIKQLEIIKDYEAGRITDPLTVQRAKQYQYEAGNYVDGQADYLEYKNQLMEQEAQECGYSAQNIQEQVEKNLEGVFPLIWRTFGYYNKMV
jgi:hypothetical protein